MILLDAIFICQGGGKVLLDILVKRFEENNIAVFYLFDNRLINEYHEIPNDRKLFLPGSYFKRHQFYLKNKNTFSSVLSFGNIPPSVKLTVPVYTYFHNVLYFGMGKEFNLLERFGYFIRRIILIYTAKNTSEFWVQTPIVQKQMKANLILFKRPICIFPFYRSEKAASKSKIDKKDDFMYLSNGYPHKNVEILLKAWQILFNNGYKNKLHLTISSEYTELILAINNLKSKGLSIENHGLTDPIKLFEQCRYQVYPSLKESLGLPIIESIINNTEIIGANLPYLHEIVNPLKTFNPNSEIELSNVIEDVINNDDRSVFSSSLKISDQLNQMIIKLTSNK